MATITAAAGGGNWTVGGTWVGGVAPTAADDAVLTSTSGAVSITAGSVARSLDCTGYTSTLTHNAGTTLTLGDPTAGAGNVALKLVAGMTYIASPASSAISFISTSTTQQTINWGGKTTGNATFNGVGGNWAVQDTWTAGGATITLTNGTLNTNGQTCSWSVFSSSNANVRTLTLGGSAITCGGTGTAWDITTVTNITVTSNTATVTLSGAGVTFSSGTLNYNGMSLTLSGSGTAAIGTGSVTLGTLTRTGTAVKTDALQINGTPTITATNVTINGNSATNRVLVRSNTLGTAATIACSGTINVSNLDFQDITWSPAQNFSAVTGNSGNCGGNTGITFTTSAAQSWNSASGSTWSDVTKWTSRVPLPQDDVTVSTAFSASQTITMDMPRSGRSISFSGSSGGLTVDPNTVTTIFGSLNLTGIGTLSASAAAWTFGGRSSFTVTSAGFSYNKALNFSAPSGTYTLQDALSLTGGVTVTNGTFTSNNQTVTADTFTATGAGVTANFGSSSINITNTGTTQFIFLRTSSAAITMGAATLNITAASSASRTLSFTGVNASSATVNYTVAGSTGPLMISGAVTIGTLNFSDASNARTLLIQVSTTVTIAGTFNVQGSSGKLVTIAAGNSSGVLATGTAATLVKTSGSVNCDYLSIRDSTVSGGASWYAGANSTNVSNNTGWIFQAYSPSKFMGFI